MPGTTWTPFLSGRYRNSAEGGRPPLLPCMSSVGVHGCPHLPSLTGARPCCSSVPTCRIHTNPTCPLLVPHLPPTTFRLSPHRGKTVLLFGGGETAADLSLEISCVSESVGLSCPSGLSLIPKAGHFLPFMVSQHLGVWWRW